MTSPKLAARDLAQIAIFAAIIAALGLPGSLSIGGGAVPITFQTLGVMLAGAILGTRKGFLAVLLFLVLAAAGLPLLSGRGGLVWFTTAPSAGYPYGFLLGVTVIGFLTARLLPRYPFWPAIGATFLGGVLAVYLIGIPVTAINVHIPLWAAAVDSLKFLPGDVVKVVATVLVARQVHKAYPGLIAPRRWRNAPVVPTTTAPNTPNAPEAPAPVTPVAP